MKYQLEIRRAAEKQYEKLPQRVQIQIARTILLLKENPYPQHCKKLQSSMGLYRLRVGDYRIVYEIHEKVLLIVVIRSGHRREA